MIFPLPTPLIIRSLKHKKSIVRKMVVGKISNQMIFVNGSSIMLLMNVTLDRQDFYEKLELAAKISTKHITLPVLQCVLLEVKNDQLLIRSTNLEIGIEVIIKAEVEVEGVVAVPASVLLQTVNLNSQKNINLRSEDGSLVVSTEGSETAIKCVPHDDFPSIPKVEGSGQTLKGGLFALGIKTASFAASLSSIKPELGSVYIYQKKEHSLTFVATDSFRLMEKTVPQKGVVFEMGVLVPQKNAIELARVCDQIGSDPTIRFNDNQLALEFSEGVYITSRLVSGSFPDYEQIIPKEYVAHSKILKEDLVHCFKKTSIFLNKFFQVSLHFDKQSVVVSALSGELGNTTESIKAEGSGEELTLSFNQRYIAEALSHFVDDSIVLNMAGVGRPLVIKGVSDGSVRYLVMPMNK